MPRSHYSFISPKRNRCLRATHAAQREREREKKKIYSFRLKKKKFVNLCRAGGVAGPGFEKSGQEIGFSLGLLSRGCYPPGRCRLKSSRRRVCCKLMAVAVATVKPSLGEARLTSRLCAGGGQVGGWMPTDMCPPQKTARQAALPPLPL